VLAVWWCEQDAVAAAGPLLVILGFIFLPLIWSVPEALITAELATAFPEDSGYVAWVTAAFGPFWGFQVSSPSQLHSHESKPS
jgi:amino acid transporter